VGQPGGKNNRKMEPVCVVWSVGQPKRKNNEKNGVWGSPKGKPNVCVCARVCSFPAAVLVRSSRQKVCVCVCVFVCV